MEGDQDKTAFYTHELLYQFRLMLFGLCNTLLTFDLLKDVVLESFLGEGALYTWTVLWCMAAIPGVPRSTAESAG